MASPRQEALRVIQEILAPLIHADGGMLYVVRAADDVVELHLAGRYAGGPGNMLMTRRIIEPAIRTVAPNTRVVVTSGALIPDGAHRVGGVGPTKRPP
jgi:Fe-S cluster biogenesis protein NfuA